MYLGGLDWSPLSQSTAFGSTGHIVTQIPQIVHFVISMTGLWVILFLMKVLNFPPELDTGGIRFTSKLGSRKDSILPPTTSIFSTWYVPSPAFSPGLDVGTISGSRSIILQAVAVDRQR